MRTTSLALLLSVPLMAGCLAGPGPAVASDVAPPAAPEQVPLVWDLTDCEALSWEVPVPASRLATRLPPGFSPMPVGPTDGTTPAGVERVAVLGFEAVECAAGFGTHERIARSLPFARLYTPVVPPQDQADNRPGAQHAFVWAAVVSDDAWRQRLLAHGLPVVDGGTLVGPTAQGYSGRMALDGIGTFSFDGRNDGNDQALGDEPFRDFTPATGGLAAWVGARESLRTTNGVGLWQASSGSWVAEVLGATEGAATFHLDRFTVPHEAIIRPGSGGEPFVGPADE